MFSGSLPAQSAPKHSTPAGSSLLTVGVGVGVVSLPAVSSLPPFVRNTAAAITTSAPTTPARNIVSRRFPRFPSGEPPERGRASSGGPPAEPAEPAGPAMADGPKEPDGPRPDDPDAPAEPDAPALDAPRPPGYPYPPDDPDVPEGVATTPQPPPREPELPPEPLPPPAPAPCGVRRSSPCTGVPGGTVGATPAGPAIPGVGAAVALPPARAGFPFRPPLAGVDPNSPSAARAWEIRIASMVMSWRISERLQALSASSHIVVRWTGLVPVTSARATIAPFGASSRPFRYRSQDVLLYPVRSATAATLSPLRSTSRRS
jgi:hypothetical protein